MGTPESSFVEALHAEHANLFRQIQKLEESLGAVPSRTELSSHLSTVRALITDHFRFEEEGGYMAPLLKEEPRFGTLVKVLLAEHREMADALDAIIREVQATTSVPDAACDQLRTWLKKLRRHESRENSLVQEGYYSSGATGD